MSSHTAPRFIAAILLAAVLLAACSRQESGQPPGAAAAALSIPLSDCHLSAPGLPVRRAARCGQLAVYEDREAGSGRQIQLHIAILPAVSRNPQPDPLFFLTGGPGQAATESYLQVSPAFERIRQKRDIVLVDQRGTGSSNPLDCPRLESDSNSGSSEEDLQAVQACLEGLDANPALYTTTLAMQDLDQARAALGYERINLYGVSYGTRAALTYLHMFPEQVRTVILDGVVPQSAVLGLNAAQDAERALDRAFDRCEVSPDCRQAFPALRSDFEKLVKALRHEPAQVTIPHPISGETTEVSFTAEELANTVRLLTYAPETVALLPLLITQAAASGELDLLAAQYLVLSSSQVDSLSIGMNYSVLCAEDVPYLSREAAGRANQGTYLGDLLTDQLFNVCEVWPSGQAPSGFKDPVSSDVPVLLLSGENDPVTPPSNAEIAAETLPNSLALVAAGQGHNVIYRGCLPRLADDFIQRGSLERLDTSCLARIQAMPFFTSFSGPQP